MANGIVEPAAGAPAPEEPTTSATEGAELPEEILRIPVFQAIISRAVPAVSMDIKAMAKRDEGKAIAKHGSALQSSGVGFYRALDNATGVMFNQLALPAQQLQEADQQGQLTAIAPPFDTVNDSIARSGSENPVLTASAPVPVAPTPAPPTPPQTSSGMLPPPPASTQTRLAGARARNLQEGSPTSGRAAQGRLLNNLLKPAI
jgi:hypothetical protein